jgi:Bifunctional DNA primase/polymerase, N-terminal/Family of unknown function (DUF5906)/Primase C terminal 2 (PriCT-2)
LWRECFGYSSINSDLKPMPLIDFALQYAARGWRIFPLRPRSKLPLIARKAGGRGFLDASADIKQITAWWTAHPSANIGLATGLSGLVVLDTDGAEGLAQLQELARRHGALPRTLCAKTGREGGFHIFFRGQGVKSTAGNKKQGDYLDIRGDGGYVVLAPSVHPSGKEYEWVDSTMPIAEWPAWLGAWRGRGKQEDLIGKEASIGPTEAAGEGVFNGQGEGKVGRGLTARTLKILAESPGFTKIEADRLRSALSVIDAATDYTTWIAYGAALHDLKWIGNEVDYGFEIWNEWSSKAPAVPAINGYPGREELERKWASFNRKYNGVRATVASIFKAAADRGWSYEIKPESVNGYNSLATIVPQLSQSTPSNPLIELNDKYQVIGDVGGKCLVMSWIASKVDEKVLVPSFQTFKSFAERYAHRYVQINQEARQIGAYWLKWPLRRSFEAMDLVPGGEAILPGNVLNLWRGFAVDPVPGDWTRMREHIAHVLAGSERASAEYIIRFAAWAVQHPGERAEVALVFRGGKGSGKGTFANAMRHIFGPHGLHVFNSKHLIGAFNGHLRACLLLFADEAFWAGDKQGESVLKGMVTERTLMIEQKGVDAAPWRNRLHVIMAANADWVIPASHDERRYAAFDVASDRIGDREYFCALHQQMHQGGLAAMLHDLLALDLGDWHPRQIVQTDALQYQKARSLPPIAEWWEQILQSGILPFASSTRGVLINEVSSNTLVNLVREFAPKAGGINPTRIGLFLKSMGSVGVHRMKGNHWKMLELGAHRAKWEKHFGKWNWLYQLRGWNQE